MEPIRLSTGDLMMIFPPEGPNQTFDEYVDIYSMARAFKKKQDRQAEVSFVECHEIRKFDVEEMGLIIGRMMSTKGIDVEMEFESTIEEDADDEGSEVSFVMEKFKPTWHFLDIFLMLHGTWLNPFKVAFCDLGIYTFGESKYAMYWCASYCMALLEYDLDVDECIAKASTELGKYVFKSHGRLEADYKRERNENRIEYVSSCRSLR